MTIETTKAEGVAIRARCAWCNQTEGSTDSAPASLAETESDGSVKSRETHIICVPCLEATLAEWREHVASRSASARQALSAC